MTQLSQLKPDPTLTVATYDSVTPAIRLHFDIDMIPTILSGSALFARYLQLELELDSNTWETPFRAHFPVLNEVTNLGDDVVSYINPTMEFMSTEGWPLDVFTDFPLLIEPVLTSVDFLSGPPRLRLVFDRNMIEVPIDGANFFFRHTDVEEALQFQQWITPRVLIFDTTPLIPDSGPNVLSFIGNVMPLMSTPGAPLPDFTDFPVP